MKTVNSAAEMGKIRSRSVTFFVGFEVESYFVFCYFVGVWWNRSLVLNFKIETKNDLV